MEKVLLIYFAFFVLLCVFYFLNIFSIKDKVLNSQLFYRMSVANIKFTSDYGRLTLKLSYLSSFTQYLWGGRNLNYKYGNYAHDLWLDAYDTAGIIPFVFLIIFTVILILVVIKTVFNRKEAIGFRILTSCFFIIAFAQCFVEPVLDGLPFLFIIMCMVGGMLSNRIKLNTQNGLLR